MLLAPELAPGRVVGCGRRRDIGASGTVAASWLGEGTLRALVPSVLRRRGRRGRAGRGAGRGRARRRCRCGSCSAWSPGRGRARRGARRDRARRRPSVRPLRVCRRRFRAEAGPRRALSSAGLRLCSTRSLRAGTPFHAGAASIGARWGSPAACRASVVLAAVAVRPNGLRPSIGPFFASVAPAQVMRAYAGRSAIRASAGANRSGRERSRPPQPVARTASRSPPLRNAPVFL